MIYGGLKAKKSKDEYFFDKSQYQIGIKRLQETDLRYLNIWVLIKKNDLLKLCVLKEK